MSQRVHHFTKHKEHWRVCLIQQVKVLHSNASDLFLRRCRLQDIKVWLQCKGPWTHATAMCTKQIIQTGVPSSGAAHAWDFEAKTSLCPARCSVLPKAACYRIQLRVSGLGVPQMLSPWLIFARSPWVTMNIKSSYSRFHDFLIIDQFYPGIQFSRLF